MYHIIPIPAKFAESVRGNVLKTGPGPPLLGLGKPSGFVGDLCFPLQISISSAKTQEKQKCYPQGGKDSQDDISNAFLVLCKIYCFIFRVGMEMHAIYQQRRIEKVNPKGPAGLGGPFFYGSSIPTVPATYRGRSMLPASDLHCYRSTLRNLQGNPKLVATGPCFLESWCQKGCHLRRGAGNHKVLDSDTQSSKSQVEEKILVQTLAIPCEKDEYAKGPETEALNNKKSREANEKPTTALANACGELEPTHTKPWGAHGASIEAKAWDGVKEKASEQVFAACGENNGVCPPISQPSVPGGCPGANGRSS